MRRITLSLLLLLSIPFVYLGVIWRQLPLRVPLHFTLDGKADRYGSKIELLLLIVSISLITILVYLLITNIHRLDPKRAAAGNKDRMRKMGLAIVVFMISVQAWLIYITQKEEVNFSLKFIFMALGLLLAVIGNYMPNLKPNYFAGFRLPWTLENEDNWRKTHLLAGKFWFGGGLFSALLFLALPYKIAFIAFVFLMLIMIFIPAVYSYQLFKKSK